MTLLQQIVPIPMPIYSGSDQPMSTETAATLIGILIILNIIALVCVVVQSIRWILRGKLFSGYSWFDYLMSNLAGEIILWCVAIIDALVLIFLMGEWVGEIFNFQKYLS